MQMCILEIQALTIFRVLNKYVTVCYGLNVGFPTKTNVEINCHYIGVKR